MRTAYLNISVKKHINNTCGIINIPCGSSFVDFVDGPSTNFYPKKPVN